MSVLRNFGKIDPEIIS